MTCRLPDRLPRRGRISARTVRCIARRLGVEPTRALADGLAVEREHADVTRLRPLTTARIALAHLRERTDYYARLKRFVE